MNPSAGRLRAALGCTLLALLLACVPATASANKVAFGAYTPGAPYDGGQVIDDFAATIGRKPVVIHWYRNWDEDLIVPRDVQTVADHAAVPLVTWEPYGHPLRSISGGSYDGYIHAAARQLAAVGNPVFVRFGHEMNGGWFSWGLGNGGNTAGDYVRAWRHVVRIFRSEGATNARFVWCPNTGKFDSLYPGDDYVDWLCLDGYNWGAKWDTWDSWDDVFRSSYNDITHLSGKPLMIAETGVNEEGGDKAGWIRDSFSAVTMIRYPRLRAVLLFNHDQDGAVWRIDSSTSALRAYRQALSDPIFGLDAKGLVASQGSSSDPSPPAHPQPANHPQPAASHPHRRSGLRCWARHLRRLNVLPTWDVAVPFRCAAAGSGSALGVVTVRTPSGRLLGRARVDLQPRADSELVVGVPGWARSSLRSQWRLRAVVKLVVSSGRYHATTRHIRLVRG